MNPHPPPDTEAVAQEVERLPYEVRAPRGHTPVITTYHQPRFRERFPALQLVALARFAAAHHRFGLGWGSGEGHQFAELALHRVAPSVEYSLCDDDPGSPDATAGA